MTTPRAYSVPPGDLRIDLDLSKNEGLTDAASLIAGIEDPERVVSRYPDVSPLRALLAELHDVESESVLVTAGGDDSLGRCFPALVGHGGRAATTFPTFEMIRRFAEQWAITLHEIPWWRDDIPVSELAAAAPRSPTLFIVSPNNPTGAVVKPAELELLASHFEHVVVDGAYEEFAEQGLTKTALTLGNVVVVRTLSKAYGLAGLRLGFLLGPPETISRISAFGNPYPVSGPSIDLALGRLSEPADGTVSFVTGIKSRRSRLTDELTSLGLDVLPSQANFVLAVGPTASWLADGARSLGIALRRFGEEPALADAVRITVPRTDEEMERLSSTMRSVLAPEAILFDVDGVMVDVSRSQTESIVVTARHFGAGAEAGDVQLLKDRGNANNDWELVRALCSASGIEVSLTDVIEAYEPLYQGTEAEPGLKRHETPLIDAAALERWSKRFKIGVVTGRPRWEAEEVLQRFGLSSHVDVLIAMEDAPLKPDPAPIRLAMDRLGVKRAWMVGDTPDDLNAARQAEVVPIGTIAPGDEATRARSSLGMIAARVLSTVNQLEELLS
jgi:histidinol-phosphate aminotransferase